MKLQKLESGNALMSMNCGAKELRFRLEMCVLDHADTHEVSRVDAFLYKLSSSFSYFHVTIDIVLFDLSSVELRIEIT